MASTASSIIWLNGRLLPVSGACISPLDHGLLVGDGAFETLVSCSGVPFAHKRHWQRLKSSCDALGIAVPDSQMLLDGMKEVMKANQLPDARLRITVTSGEGPLGSDRGGQPPTVIIACSSLTPWPETDALITVPWPRNERSALAGVKSISYAENVRALAFARSKGCGEALFTNTRGELCEGTGSNLFLVKSGQVITPPLSSGCLAGVTRGLVIETCQSNGIPIEERPVSPDEVAGCSEAFLSSTTREVQAVARIDDHIFHGAPGPVTTTLRHLFKEFAARLTASPE